MKRGFLRNPKSSKFNEVKDVLSEKSTSSSVLNTANQVSTPRRDLQIVAIDKLYLPRTVELPLNWSSTSVHPKALIFTTISDTSDDGYGTCDCILYARTKLQLQSTPGFPCLPMPLHRNFNPSCPLYKIKSSGTKGLGVFATRPLKVGDLILVERPLVVLPMDTDLNGVKSCPGFLRAETEMNRGCKSSFSCVTEAMLNVVFGRMTKKNQEAYLSLAQGPRAARGSKLSAIWNTNAYEFERLSAIKGEDIYATIPKDMSRLNHSCRPNCAHNFDPNSFTFELRATKPIDAGEEILYSYVKPCQPTEARREILNTNYGFSCSCISCVPNPTDPCNDTIRTSIPSRMLALSELCQELGSEKKYDEELKIFEISASLHIDMEQEGLDGYFDWYKHTREICYSAASFLYDITRSGKYTAAERSRWRREELRYQKRWLLVLLAVEGSYGLRDGRFKQEQLKDVYKILEVL